MAASALADANTCNGPVTSSNCTAGYASTSIERRRFGEKRGLVGVIAETCRARFALSIAQGKFEGSSMIAHDVHLRIGSLLFEGVDQIDLTGPFEVLSRIPNSTYRIYGKTAEPVRDIKGLRLTPDATLADAPPLDVLHVPGGFGQQALMEDTEVLGWINRQAAGACRIFSVCTGALICGAAGLLKGRRATTHWASFHLLPFFGATPVNQRVVVDGSFVFAAGVTAGIDGALRLAAELRGDDAARAIQLYMVYAPEPPFDSGTPETAPPEILQQSRQAVRAITEQREETARRVAARLGVTVQGEWR
ncbi:cyclohexyl-isocyanide hydratase [Bradyrhizobium sp. USDA 3315]